ncbi:MAG: hypothetical protein U0V74_00380 [Chitinophagales bacterium]
MKGLLTILLCTIILQVFPARNNTLYHRYLLSNIKAQPVSSFTSSTPSIPNLVPRYSIPKGNVFCIMEDKLTRATGIWIKVGVK